MLSLGAFLLLTYYFFNIPPQELCLYDITRDILWQMTNSSFFQYGWATDYLYIVTAFLHDSATSVDLSVCYFFTSLTILHVIIN